MILASGIEQRSNKKGHFKKNRGSNQTNQRTTLTSFTFRANRKASGERDSDVDVHHQSASSIIIDKNFEVSLHEEELKDEAARDMKSNLSKE